MTVDILPVLFLLLITCSVGGTTGCGRDIQAPTKISHMVTQDNNTLLCEWRLLSSSQSYQLEFETFDLQRSPKCFKEFLEIYTGSGQDEQLVDQWCGQEFPEIIVLSQGRVVFHSNEGRLGPRFNITVKYIGESAFHNVHIPIMVTEKPVMLYAPYYRESGLYGKNLNFNWKLMAAAPDRVLQIEYRLECERVPMSVRAFQYSPNFPRPISNDLLSHRCEQPFHTDVVLSYYPDVLLNVSTSSSPDSRAFRFIASAVANYTSVCPRDLQDTVYSVNVTQHPLYLAVPFDNTDHYNSNVPKCMWHVTTNLTNHLVAMELIVYNFPVDVTCDSQRLAVYDGTDNSSLRIVSACTNQDGFSSAISKQMFINASIPREPKRTFQKYSVVMKVYAKQQCDSDGELTLIADELKSYSVMYYNDNEMDQRCSWNIKIINQTLKTINVGAVTSDGLATHSPNSQCSMTNTSLVNVYSDKSQLNQVNATCPFTNSQDYRVYTRSLYLPTHTQNNVPHPKPVLSIYYYASKGICDSTREITLEATPQVQSLFSPNSPNNYWSNEHCRWRLHAFAPHFTVSFRVVSFETEELRWMPCSVDRSNIAFYDGSYSPGNRLSLRCAGTGTSWIMAKGRDVLVEFKSFSGPGGKFEIEYKAYHNDSSCNKELEASSSAKNLSSIGFPIETAKFSSCWWTISAVRDDKVVYVQVLQTNLHSDEIFNECAGEHVEAYDGRDANEGMIKRWCGTETPLIKSSGKYMYLKYKTLNYQNSTGFLLSYYTADATINHCGSTSLKADDEDAYLSTPNYPDNYKNNMDCQWMITASSSLNTVKIQVLEAHLEYDCSFDNVSIYDGPSSNGVLLQMFCAKSQPTLQSATRQMFIRFRSDSSRTHRGFRLKYYQTADDPPNLVCNKMLISGDEYRYLESPGYPNLYPSNLYCWWQITSSDPSGKIIIEVVQSVLEYSFSCSNDYVSVRDGDADGEELGRFCGDHEPSYKSTKRSVYILFKTNTDINGMGFKLKYITTKPCEEGTVKDLVVRVFPDYIESPNYPNKYPNGLSCMWRLHTNISNYIKVTVINSDIELTTDCIYDYMAAFDGFNEASPMLRKWCGYQTPTITSSGSVMFLKFRSDGSGLNTGFHLQYSGVNTPPYGSTLGTLKAGTVAGVVCGVVVITSILVVIIFIIVRRKHKNQQHAGRNRIHRNRRSHRNYRLPSNGEPCRWEVNHVFYSNHSGDAIISPPPYSFVAGTPFIYESPPPYPAEEFVRLPKDDGDERLSGQIINDDAQNTSPQSWIADPTTSRGTDECNNVETVESQRSGEAATSIIHSKPKPRYSIKPNASRESTSGRHLAQTNRAISVDNLMPECQPLSLAVPRSQETSSRLSSQTRAASVDNLLSGGTGRQERGYDRRVSQSEMMLNRDTERQDTNTYQQSAGTTMSRPNRRPERPVRQREREDIRRRTLSDHRPEDPSTNDGAQRSSNRASENRYKRTGKETTEPMGHRYRQRSEFEDMRQRSRSCENLTSDRPSNHSQQNPRWSVASEGYMNERYPSAHRAGNYGNTSASVSNIPERANRAVLTERVPSRSGSGLLVGETRASSPQRRNLNPAKDDKIHPGREPDHHVRPLRQNNSPDRHVRPSQYSSRGNLTKVEEEVSGYAGRSSEVLAFDDNVSLSGERGQPTETSV